MRSLTYRPLPTPPKHSRLHDSAISALITALPDHDLDAQRIRPNDLRVNVSIIADMLPDHQYAIADSPDSRSSSRLGLNDAMLRGAKTCADDCDFRGWKLTTDD